MSRRYGRNQKRRAREEIARLGTDLERQASALERSRRLAQENLRRAYDAEDEIACAKDLLPPHSALASPELLRGLRVGVGEPVRVEVTPFESAPVSHCDIAASCDTVMFQRVTLEQLVTSVSVDQLSGMAHAHVRLLNGKVAYAISRQALRDMSQRAFHHLVGKQLTECLYAELKRQGVV